MTCWLVSALQQLGIEKHKILISLQEGSDEVDVLADMFGALVMFELKDQEFSKGNAYSFAARISLYNPDYQAIVSAKGVSSEVKDHFKRIKVEMIYIEDLNNLKDRLNKVLSDLHALVSRLVILRFQAITSFDVDLLGVLESRISLS